MATNVFISFRFSDGEYLKEELVDLFDSSTEVIDCSEDEDRSQMSEETIREYLYKKLKNTSVTIVILTPEAINYRKGLFGNYDDWLYDELRYSLEDRNANRTNGAIALYTDESKDELFRYSKHICEVCNEETNVKSMNSFNNLVRKNMMNVKNQYKKNKCNDIYDANEDSYISLVHFDDFKKQYNHYIDIAKSKRDRMDQFELVKKMK